MVQGTRRANQLRFMAHCFATSRSCAGKCLISANDAVIHVASEISALMNTLASLSLALSENDLDQPLEQLGQRDHGEHQRCDRGERRYRESNGCLHAYRRETHGPHHFVTVAQIGQ